MFFSCKVSRRIRSFITKRNSCASCPRNRTRLLIDLRDEIKHRTSNINYSVIYLDYNATTPLCDEAREAMLPYLDRHFGNPSSVHVAGREARAAIDDTRDKLAALLHAKPHELVFTSGGTESCNLAVLGLARCPLSRGGHVISNKAEHHAVLNALEYLEKRENFEVTWLNMSRDGIADLDQLASAIRPGTENVAAIAGMAAATDFALKEQEKEQQREKVLRDKLWTCITQIFPAAQQNGDSVRRLPNTLNVSFPGFDSETLLMVLDLEGVCASSGSACMVGSVVASHVLLAMGLSMERASSAVRFSLGKQTTAEEIERAADAIARIFERLAKT